MRRQTLALCVAFIFATAALAQPGSLDLSFNPTDIGFGYGDGANNPVYTTAIQADGKIIIGGDFTSLNGTAINRIARLNKDGTLDGGFNPGTGANDYVRITAAQADGRIIIGGSFNSFNGTAINRIARLNMDGTLDAAFNPGTGTGTYNYVNTIAIQADGKIIIGGGLTSLNGTAINNITRLNTDGTLDGTFNPGTGANNSVETTAIQADGKIIIGGFFTSFNGTSRKYIARLNTDGTLDGTFNPGVGADNFIYTTSIQADGKIIIGGSFNSFNGTAINRIARLNMDGTLDAAFNPGTVNPGAGADKSIYTTAIQADGKIIIGGSFISFNGTPRNYIARLNTDGSLDAAFNPGTAASNFIYTTAIQADGKIIIGGNFTSFNGIVINRITRLNTDGTLDGSFNPGTGTNNYISTTAIQPDGKIIIGGNFTSLNGRPRNSIARLNTDGTLDVSFNPGMGANDYVRTTAIQADGKIIIGGTFTSFNGTVINRIARLNTDGTLDVSFNPGTGADYTISTLAIQADGKIIIGGYFINFNGMPRNHIARLNTDGSLDVSFNPGTGVSSFVTTTAIQADGKIIIGGGFDSFNGTARNNIVRLSTDGTLDASFNPGTGANNDVFTTAIQADGKIIIGGYFSNFNGAAINRIARLNTDGTLDASFNPETGVTNYSSISTSAIQADGKIIIGGTFTTFNWIPKNYIVRLNTDGTLDATFNPGTGASSFVGTTAIQADGKIIIGGYFTSYDGVARNNIARINGDEIIGGPLPVTLLSFIANKIKNAVLLQWQTADEQNTSRFIIEKSTDGNSFEAIGNVAAKNTTGNHNYEFTDAAAWVGNTQYYRLKMMDIDGRFTYSNIVRVANNSTGAVAVYPNPASDIVVIQQSNNNKLLTKARLLDISGKMIQSVSITSYQQKVSLQHLSAGVYMIQFEDGSNVKVVKR